MYLKFMLLEFCRKKYALLFLALFSGNELSVSPSVLQNLFFVRGTNLTNFSLRESV